MKKEIKILIIVLGIIGVCLIALLAYKFIFSNDEDVKVTVIDSIGDYGYNLDDNETTLYKDLFNQLKGVLETVEKDNNDYALLVAKLFVSDFYTLDNKLTKTDIGGSQFIHKDIIENFSLKATDTFYKYLENNLDGKRSNKYPVVISFTSEEIEEVTYEINEEEMSAYKVMLSWSYDIDTDYQKDAIIYLVSEDNKLSIVELEKID